MQSAIERRQEILETLSDRRFETIDNLAAQFGVSRRTIRYDIEITIQLTLKYFHPNPSIPDFSIEIPKGGGVNDRFQ